MYRYHGPRVHCRIGSYLLVIGGGWFTRLMCTCVIFNDIEDIGLVSKLNPIVV